MSNLKYITPTRFGGLHTINREKGNKMKIAFYTLGCKVNQYETNAMSQAFIEKGHSIADFEEEADIYIINTCTVTNIADRKSRQMLRRAKHRI